MFFYESYAINYYIFYNSFNYSYVKLDIQENNKEKWICFNDENYHTINFNRINNSNEIINIFYRMKIHKEISLIY